MVTDMKASATKQDLADHAKVMKQDLADVRTEMATKQHLEDHRKMNRQDLEDMKKEIIDSVLFLNENLFHNFQGAFKDRTELLKDKIYVHDHEINRIKHFLHLI